ncbi:verprolin [Polyplosphaeria fusca]|uniref:Verprolin n=1 Tax=Polyplosphaeria fusca TaxID=682080 RepID=A0A9P4UWK5_9PLEO|nr:verprolin [Polyplosphaeria fusca]
MPEILPSAAYHPAALGTLDPQDAVSPLVQRHTLGAYVDDDDSTIPRYYFAPRYSPTSTYQPSLISPQTCDDFPTPKARLYDMMRPSPQASPRHLVPSYPSHHRVSRADSDFDSLYDITDDEAEVPLQASKSVKKDAHSSARSSRNRYPSILIPSPSAWPTIEKLRSAMSSVPPTPNRLLTPSRQALSSITSHNLKVPASSATPSLDGSLTSEEMDKLSCPSTPETQKRQSIDSVESWSPVQLDDQALQTLQSIGRFSTDYLQEPPPSQVIEVNDTRADEMQEVSRPSLRLSISHTLIQNMSSGNTPVSELSIPSPGGFFASLHSNVRHTWSMPRKANESGPNTSTAEKFYQLPWDSRRNTIAEQTVTLGGSTLDGYDDGLPTSRPVVLADIDESLEVKEIDPSKTIFQYNERYHVELQKLSTANLARTGHWVEEQDELQAALREMNDLGSPSLSSSSHSRGNSLDKVVKKSVKFAEDPKKSPTEEKAPKQIVTYVQGLEYICERSRKNDPFIHRQTRSEAMHVIRRCMVQAHRDQLLGKFELANPVRPSPPRPVSEFYMDDPTVLKERIARAQMERQALDQILPITWMLQALKQLNGGKLISKAGSRRIVRMQAPRILDVGGIATNDWAWQVAYDYPYATITTVFTAGNNLTENVAGPENHKRVTVPNLWTLPFPNAHFDIVSARSLYELLKTDKPLGRSLDEYDLCLKECFRCLKPGGVIEFSLIDADVIHAGRQAQAMGVEFGFNLKTRGYDAAPTKLFIPRLHKAGFQDVHRMWMVLPMGKTAANWKDVLQVGAESGLQERSISPEGQVEVSEAPVFGTTLDAAMMTGIVGSWMWERWLLRLQVEMGKEEDKLLEGVVNVLEEGATLGSGWRYLTGYARKKV